MSLRGYLFLNLYTAKSRVTEMPKKPRVKILMHIQHVKGSETHLTSARKYFCDIFLSFRKKISAKNFVLVVSEILILFINILPPNEMSCLSVKTTV